MIVQITQATFIFGQNDDSEVPPPKKNVEAKTKSNESPTRKMPTKASNVNISVFLLLDILMENLNI